MRFPKLFGLVRIGVLFLCLIFINGSAEYKECAGEMRINFASVPGFKSEMVSQCLIEKKARKYLVLEGERLVPPAETSDHGSYRNPPSSDR